jgi:membrane protein implicated in regulation of membrane protease activity
MLIWSALLFFLGVMAFLDSVFNMGEIFRQVNSVVFLLVSLALLIRTTTKSREQRTEKLQNRVFNLEREVSKLQAEQKKMVEF